MKNPGKNLQRITWVYSFAVLIWFLLWLAVGDGPWWLTTLNRVVPHLFLPVPLFMIWIVLARRFRLIFILVPPALIFSYLFHPYILPRFAGGRHRRRNWL